MADPAARISVLALLGLAVFLLGEDVEHPAVDIAPPPSPKAAPKPVAPVLPQPESDPPEGPRLPFGLSGPTRLDLEGGHEFVAPPVRPELAEHQRVRQRLEGYLADLLARDRVRTGRIDPAWLDLTRRIEHYWTPGFELILDPKVAEVSGAWLRNETYKTLHGWYLDAQRRRTDPFARPERVPGDEALTAWTNALDLQRDALSSDDYGNQVVTLVEIRFGSDGSSEARMLASSGHPLYDQVAMEGVEQAMTQTWGDNPPPGPARSILALQSRYAILPPIPAVGFTFDEVLGNFDLFYPFKKMVTSKAVLVAVYREDPPP